MNGIELMLLCFSALMVVVPGAIGRNLGKRQMSTDTAVYTSKLIIQDQIPLEKIAFVDGILVNTAEDAKIEDVVPMSPSMARLIMGPNDGEEEDDHGNAEAEEDDPVVFRECTEVWSCFICVVVFLLLCLFF